MSVPTRFLLQASAVGVVLGSASLLGGCAAGPATGSPNPNCTLVVELSPSVASADHAALMPANEASFSTGSLEQCTNGASPQVMLRLYPTWTNPDPINIQISSAQDNTNGTAVCKGPTNGAVTLTATGTNGTTPYAKTVQLTCQ